MIIHIFLSTTAFAVDPPHHDAKMLETLYQMRLKQEGEENVVRVIQQPVTVQNDTVCSAAEQARQRIRDLGGGDGKKFGTISLEAGHGSVSIDGNSGEINNSVNVQVIAPNDRKCF